MKSSVELQLQALLQEYKIYFTEINQDGYSPLVSWGYESPYYYHVIY